MWDLLAIQNQPVAALTPWMVGVGNHEQFYNWAAYMARYKMPMNTIQDSGYASEGNFWYAFTYGNVRWISISSEHPLDDGSPQRTFLEKSLASAVANRNLVPWIILSIHKPLYCSDSHSGDFYRTAIESLMLEHDVDLVISGTVTFPRIFNFHR